MSQQTETSETGRPARQPIHTRAIVFTCYTREDGLWDVEGSIQDSKHYVHKPLERDLLQAGTPYHSMRVTLTVDDSLCIVQVTGAMLAAPFDLCPSALLPLQKLVGLSLGRGWRKSVDTALTRNCSCTHIREMLYSAPSAAIQAIPGYRKQISGERWPPEIPSSDGPPHFIGGCVSWRQDGAVVLRHYPQFHNPGIEET